ncbi:MAG TPA: hypothetical protein VG797_05090, partial [Phycisphaerales bacterium]|nr:hypothetical protein [Phycisphaerales bacterium]
MPDQGGAEAIVMNTRARLAAVAVLALPAIMCSGQLVDPEVAEAGNKIAQTLRELGQAYVPPGSDLWLSSRDGRVLSWSVTLPDGCDVTALAREVKSDAVDPRTILDD